MRSSGKLQVDKTRIGITVNNKKRHDLKPLERFLGSESLKCASRLDDSGRQRHTDRGLAATARGHWLISLFDEEVSFFRIHSAKISGGSGWRYDNRYRYVR